MSDFDSLDIQIAAQADHANDSLDKLIEKLEKVKDILGNGNAAKALGDSVKNASASVGGSMQKVEQKVSATTTKIAKSFDEIAAKVAHIGVGFEIKGAGKESIQKAIDSRINQMATAMRRIQVYEANGETFSKGYEKAVQTFTILGNEVDGLKNQLKNMTVPEQTDDQLESIARAASDVAHSTKEAATETIRFGEAIELTGFQKYDHVAEQIEEIEKSMGNMANNVNIPNIAANLETATQKAFNLREVFKELKVPNATAGLDKVEAAINRTERAYKRLTDNMRDSLSRNKNFENTSAFDKQQRKAEELRNDYARLIMMQEELARAAGKERSSIAFERMSAGAKKATSAMARLVSRLKDMAKHMAKTNSLSGMLDKMTSKLSKSLLRVGNMLKLMVVRMALRKVIENVGTGFKGLALYSDEFNRSISMLIGSLKTLGYSISAAVGPLVNALAPAINRVIQMITMLVNYFNQLISALMGKGTWIRAKNQVTDYAKSVSGAGKAAKGTLLAIDELNNITSDTGGGGAGANEINPGDMFETVEIEDKIKDLSERLKEMWESGDFTDLGTMIGDGLKEKLDAIPWQKIQDGAKKAGSAIGTFITGLVKVEGLGTSIGNTLANAFNTITVFVGEFLDKTDFGAIGDFLADAINGFADKIDTAGIGHNISQALKGILDLLINFIEKTDWKKLGNKLAEILANIDWGGVVSRLYEGFGAAFGGLASFLWGLVEDAFTKLMEWLYDIAYEDGEFSIGGLLNGILEALKGIDNWIKNNIFIPFIDGFAKAFGINVSDGSKEMLWQGQKLILGLWTGIDDSTPKLSESFEKIKTIILNVWESVKTKTSEIWTSIKDALKTPINGIIGFINGMISGIATGINGLIDKLNSLSFDIPSWVPEYGGRHFGLSIPHVNVPVIPTLAEGGFVDSFSLFAAGENGIPEILGTVNGRNAVAGGAEITGIRDAIFQASSAELSMLREQNQLLQGILEKEFGISKSDIGKAARDYGKDYYNRTGNNAYVF